MTNDASTHPDPSPHATLPPLPLPDGIRSRMLGGINGLDLHVLEAGDPGRPLVVLLHGFPELAWSWRAVMPSLAAAGFHVVAPDQRGYGRTTGWDARYEGDLGQFRMLNLVRDVLGLVWALGRTEVAGLVGHDFGSPVAAWCALLRPDLFRRVALMSAPFAGVPGPGPAPGSAPAEDWRAGLRALDPPRQHYQWFYSEPGAADDLGSPPQGLPAFLRAYYHMKSGDWPGNRPVPLERWSAAELALLPEYYVMRADRGMAATVAPAMPDPAAIAGCAWLPESSLEVYAAEYARVGFQGGLSWYRARTTGRFRAEEEVFAGRTIDVPTLFVAGARDWGIHQSPGALARMQRDACPRMVGCHLVEGAGHWVQQERPAETAALLGAFLRG